MTPAQLKEARRKLGFSCSQMARALSDPDGDAPPVDPRTIRRWEAGDRTIPGPAVVAIGFMLRDHGL